MGWIMCCFLMSFCGNILVPHDAVALAHCDPSTPRSRTLERMIHRFYLDLPRPLGFREEVRSERRLCCSSL